MTTDLPLTFFLRVVKANDTCHLLYLKNKVPVFEDMATVTERDIYMIGKMEGTESSLAS